MLTTDSRTRCCSLISLAARHAEPPLSLIKCTPTTRRRTARQTRKRVICKWRQSRAWRARHTMAATRGILGRHSRTVLWDTRSYPHPIVPCGTISLLLTAHNRKSLFEQKSCFGNWSTSIYCVIVAIVLDTCPVTHATPSHRQQQAYTQLFINSCSNICWDSTLCINHGLVPRPRIDNYSLSRKSRYRSVYVNKQLKYLFFFELIRFIHGNRR